MKVTDVEESVEEGDDRTDGSTVVVGILPLFSHSPHKAVFDYTLCLDQGCTLKGPPWWKRGTRNGDPDWGNTPYNDIWEQPHFHFCLLCKSFHIPLRPTLSLFVAKGRAHVTREYVVKILTSLWKISNVMHFYFIS